MKSTIILAFILLVSGLIIAKHSFSDQPLLNTHKEESQSREMNPYENVEAPRTKRPPINASVWTLLQPLTERVWVTKYYGTPSELPVFYYDMPFCGEWPKNTANKGNASVWTYKCSPVDIKVKRTSDDLSGIITVRMLDFGKSSEILQDVFEIIKANSLGSYKIEGERKETIRNRLQKDFKIDTDGRPITTEMLFRTYPKLENYYFLKENDPETPDPAFATIVSHGNWAKKYAFSLNFDPENHKKEGEVIEFTLKTPSGFFGFGN